jgi:hypothetical protein
MPYVSRAADGSITSLHREPAGNALELLPDDHPEIRAFVGLAPRDTDGAEFRDLDADFVRVIEDVIDTLIVKNVINITDLPEQAQAKLFARKSYRERMTRNPLRLFSNSAFTTVIDDTGFDSLS